MTTEREEALELAREAGFWGQTWDKNYEESFIRLVRLAKQRGADSVMNVLIDEAITSWALTAENEDDPRKLIHAIVEFAVQIALDPAVSENARNLMKRGAEEQKRKIQDCPAVTLLLEACDYGQFSADFDQPQAKPVRAAILEVCKMLRDIGAIEEQP